MNLKMLWKMRAWLRLLLILLLGVPVSAHAQKQKKTVVVYRDSITGKDTLVHGSVISGETMKMQYEIGLRLPDGQRRLFRAEDIQGYRDNNMLFYSCVVNVDGEERHVLLSRDYEQDSLMVYRFMDDEGRRRPYVQVGKNRLLIPLADEADADRVNPQVVAYLKSFPIAGDSRVEAFIDRMKPTLSALAKRHLVCRKGSVNYLTRFRWGVMLGGGMGKVAMDGFVYDNKLQGYAGLFADVPLYVDFSVRPEVTFHPYGYRGQFPSDVGEVNAVYNRKDVSAALMFRYTMRSFTGRWLPFVQLGPQLNCVLDKEMESAKRLMDSDGFTELTQHRYEVQKGTSFGVSGGVGVEYVVSARHSLFIDLRYSHELEDESLRGISLVLSFNL